MLTLGRLLTLSRRRLLRSRFGCGVFAFGRGCFGFRGLAGCGRFGFGRGGLGRRLLAGRRWVDLCRDHTLAVLWPSSAMSMTLEGILADLGEVLIELGVHVAAAGLHLSGGLVR